MIFLYANLHIVSKLHVKFHWNPLSGVGGDALTRSHHVNRQSATVGWIICPWNKAWWMIFPYANLHIVSKLHVKFHWNPLSGVGGDALKIYVDRRRDGRTDGQTDRVIPIDRQIDRVIPIYPPNYVCRGYKKSSSVENYANLFIHNHWLEQSDYFEQLCITLSSG